MVKFHLSYQEILMRKNEKVKIQIFDPSKWKNILNAKVSIYLNDFHGISFIQTNKNLKFVKQFKSRDFQFRIFNNSLNTIEIYFSANLTAWKKEVKLNKIFVEFVSKPHQFKENILIENNCFVHYLPEEENKLLKWHVIFINDLKLGQMKLQNNSIYQLSSLQKCSKLGNKAINNDTFKVTKSIYDALELMTREKQSDFHNITIYKIGKEKIPINFNQFHSNLKQLSLFNISLDIFMINFNSNYMKILMLYPNFELNKMLTPQFSLNSLDKINSTNKKFQYSSEYFSGKLNIMHNLILVTIPRTKIDLFLPINISRDWNFNLIKETSLDCLCEKIQSHVYLRKLASVIKSSSTSANNNYKKKLEQYQEFSRKNTFMTEKTCFRVEINNKKKSNLCLGDDSSIQKIKLKTRKRKNIQIVEDLPTIVISMDGLSEPICFDADAKHGHILQLLYDKDNDIIVNGKVEKRHDLAAINETVKYFFNEISIVLKTICIKITFNEIKINRKKYYFNKQSPFFYKSKNQKVSLVAKENVKIKIKNVVFLIKLNEILLNNFGLIKYLKFYIEEGNGLSKKLNGIIGQFWYQTATSVESSYKIIARPNNITIYSKINFKGYPSSHRSVEGWISQNNGFNNLTNFKPCWKMPKNGVGIIKGTLWEYVVPNLCFKKSSFYFNKNLVRLN